MWNECKNWNWKKAVIIAWIIISIMYISYDIINKVGFGMLNRWYRTAYSEILQWAVNKDCNAFTISDWVNKAELINVECLKNLQLINWQQTWVPEQNITNSWSQE